MNYNALLRAYRMFRSDESAETYAALTIVLAVVGPAAWQHWKAE
jgi:hypothetical protein